MEPATVLKRQMKNKGMNISEKPNKIIYILLKNMSTSLLLIDH